MNKEKYNFQTLDSAIIMAFITDIESQIPVHTWKMNNVHVWPMLRVSIRPLLLQKYQTSPSTYPPQETAKIRKGKIAQLIKEILRLPYSSILQKKNIFFLSDATSMDCKNGEWTDKFFRGLRPEIEENNYSYALFSPVPASVSPLSPTMISLKGIELFSEALAFLKIRIPHHVPHLSGHDRLIEILKDQDIDIAGFSYEKIFWNTYKIHLMERAFTFMLKRIKPRMCIIVSYYHLMGFALCRAAWKLHIPSIEIQHGTQNGIHDAYNQWTRIPSHGYPELPRIFWVWNNMDAKRISEWGSHDHIPYTGGNPNHFSWLSRNQDYREVADQITIKKTIMSAGATEAETIDVLVTLQPVGAFKPYWDILTQVINDPALSHVRWWMRQHPTSMREEKFDGLDSIMRLEGRNINFSESSEWPLPVLLQHVDIHITVRSSTALEASGFGVPTLFISDIAASEHAPLIENHMGYLHESKDEIIACLLEKNRKTYVYPRHQTNDNNTVLKNLIGNIIPQLYKAEKNDRHR